MPLAQESRHSAKEPHDNSNLDRYDVSISLSVLVEVFVRFTEV